MNARAANDLIRLTRARARGNSPQATDRELLARFAQERDESAFAELVARHTGMVLGVSRRVLNAGHDAEDVCQAVFLVLSRKAASGKWEASVANWLYATARNLATRANRAAQRRAKRERQAAIEAAVEPLDRLSAREWLNILDEELTRLPAIYREALVLCCLEGLSREEAAARLGCPLGTVKVRLERGRKRLESALTGRGVALGLGLLALAVTSPAGASPPRLVELILTAAGGSPSPAVAELAQGVAVNTWIKSVVLPLVALAGLALVAVGNAKPGAPGRPAVAKKDVPAGAPAAQEDRRVVVTGTVVGPDGKPVAGAAINTLAQGEFDRPRSQELTRTDEAGRFTARLDTLPSGRPDLRSLVAAKPGFGPDWISVAKLGERPVALKLVADDVPVTGKVTDLQGKPVPGAVVHVVSLATGDLNRVWEDWGASPNTALQHTDKVLYWPVVAGLPQSVTTDREGRIQLRGVGRGRLVGLKFEAPGIETAACRVVVDPTFDPRSVRRSSGSKMMGPPQVGPELYGARFTHAARPSQLVVGTVVDGASGKPVAGVQVSGHVAGPRWWENHAYTKTDSRGEFRLLGVAKADSVELSVFSGRGRPYFPFSTKVAGQPGLTEIPATLKLVRGVLVKGRVIERGTGKPVVGAGIRYTALADNKFYAERMRGRQSENGLSVSTDANGHFEFVVLPGAGILLAQGETRGRQMGTEYTQVRLAPEDRSRADLSRLENLGETFSAADGHIITLDSLSAYRIISPREADESVQVEMVFDRGRSVSGTVVGPDGKPAVGVKGYMLTACYDSPQTLPEGKFTAVALDPDQLRQVLFLDEARKLSAHLTLGGAEKGPVAKLRPFGTLTGRLLDAPGNPIAGAKVAAHVRGVMKNRALMMVTNQLTATTGADGRFALDVPGGNVTYHLTFTRNGKYLDTKDQERPGSTVEPGEKAHLAEIRVRE